MRTASSFSRASARRGEQQTSRANNQHTPLTATDSIIFLLRTFAVANEKKRLGGKAA